MGVEATKLTKQIRTILELNGWFVWRGGTARVRHTRIGENGNPDLHALKEGKYLACEIKIGADKLSAIQTKFLHGVKLHGGKVIIANSIPQFQSELARLCVAQLAGGME